MGPNNLVARLRLPVSVELVSWVNPMWSAIAGMYVVGEANFCGACTPTGASPARPKHPNPDLSADTPAGLGWKQATKTPVLYLCSTSKYFYRIQVPGSDGTMIRVWCSGERFVAVCRWRWRAERGVPTLATSHHNLYLSPNPTA